MISLDTLENFHERLRCICDIYLKRANRIVLIPFRNEFKLKAKNSVSKSHSANLSYIIQVW